ncbi:hypothetical protein THRCLA_03120 [Thraustotheca clavata]|uniref:Methyltransferase domain-containing protein n=1 Tax=Thraustotheca clavata TaxID=74557 RepID=A0A1W0A331_9STRA|nr:hypothetical protein THRCLA_03120 [Thraustotheca clavata]
MSFIPVDDAVRQVQAFWDSYSESYTTKINEHMTIQCARALHSYMELDTAKNILEIGAASGIGTLDILSRLSSKNSTKIHATDLSPEMVKRLETRIAPLNQKENITLSLANAQELKGHADASYDRYIASLVLQLTPDHNAMLQETYRVLEDNGLAGFVIWGAPENSGVFTLPGAMNKELDVGSRGALHPNFNLGLQLDQLKANMKKLGFRNVVSWPFLCVVEKWSGDAFATSQFNAHPLQKEDFGGDEAKLEEMKTKCHAKLTRLANEWLATKQTPIGLEVYLIIARK